MGEEDDDELISRAIAGDQAAWELLVRRYNDRLFNTALRYLNNDDEAAKDAVQAVWLRVYRTITSFNRRASFYTWLYRICKNICIDVRRTRKVVVALTGSVRARVLGVDEQVILNREMAILRRALIAMEPICREVLLLTVEGHSSSEIGAMLGKPSSTIRSITDRGRNFLALALLAEGRVWKGKEA
jgi:RNA polymerase sigma-70 factor, ECF subfamily